MPSAQAGPITVLGRLSGPIGSGTPSPPPGARPMAMGMFGADNGAVVEQRRGVILHGYRVDAVAEALRELDPRYVLVDRVPAESGRVPVLRCLHAAQVDALRAAAPGIAWLVVELYGPQLDVEHVRDPLLVLNTSKIDPGAAARAIDQPDLVTWYEIVNPVQAHTVDGGPAADDYSNLTMIMPEGHRIIAHAVRAGQTAPPCLPGDAEQVLCSDDLWAFATLRQIDVCPACTARNG